MHHHVKTPEFLQSNATLSSFDTTKDELTAVADPRLMSDRPTSMVGFVLIFTNHNLVEIEEILTVEWPKRATIRGRGVLAVLCRLGALDFATGERLDAKNITNRHYHHVYPDALLKEAGIPSFLALNCALITDKTNLTIGRKDPLQYLKDRYKWTSETIVQERLQSHLIPILELANGGYEKLSEDEKSTKLQQDFDAFLHKRAVLVMAAVEKLANGHQLSAEA